MTVQIVPDQPALAQAVAEVVAAAAAEAISDRRRFTLLLAGGSTPRTAYTLLAGDRFARKIDWAQVLLLWGDERCVPPENPLSNYRMVREVLLERVPIPPANIHRIRGEADPREAAAEYESLLRQLLGADADIDRPADRLDLVLLGIGEDGHTASLFPAHTAVKATRRWVVAEYIGAVGMWRVTLTPVVLNAARRVAFVVGGAAKAGVLRQIVEGPFTPDRLPAQAVRPGQGRLTWLVDQAAAAQLTAKR
jgi:6-phosphogluconolactonase